MKKILPVVFTAFTVFIIYLLVSSAIQKQEYLNEHCKEIGKINSSTGIGYSFVGGRVGIGTTYIASKTGYKCDDGLEYWE